ncbi:uncharacterized protein LOC141647098 [Silene latifolia]|uniref:uncharacterized protein LOC141647098 n=1 Tax=Silene latifolia TaxID=37657 RepID=UPI003D78B178
MASACVNIPISPPHPNTSFLNIPWLSPNLPDPRTADLHDSASDFEFNLVDHPISNILPADQLFSNGKLLTSTTTTAATTTTTAADTTRRKISDGGVDNYIFSPKAPRCSSRWREMLGLKNKKLSTPDSTKTTSLLSTTTSSSKSLRFSTEDSTTKTTSSASRSLKFSTEENTKTTSSSKSIKRFLTKNTRTPSSDTSLSLPLLDRSSDSSSFDSLTDSMFSISTSTSRLSLSSLSSSTSSSTHDHDDLHRLSLDETRPRVTLLRPTPNPKPNPVSTRPVRRTQKTIRQGAGTGVSADSPRMNSAGKIVFQSLNRSSSSPSSFNGGPRYKHRGMERSYSANVRITPVLNVPVCSSLRGSSKSGGFGFGQLFTSSSSSTQKKDKGSGNNTHNGDKRRTMPVVM